MILRTSIFYVVDGLDSICFISKYSFVLFFVVDDEFSLYIGKYMTMGLMKKKMKTNCHSFIHDSCDLRNVMVQMALTMAIQKHAAKK